jgi:hypothetical protein
VGDGPEDADDEGFSAVEHPTVVPAFDLSKYAAQSEVRARMPTMTDESALEQARLQSLPTRFPPARAPMSTAPPLASATPDSVVELDTSETDVDALETDEQIALLSARLAPLSRVPSLAKPMSALGAVLDDPKTAYVLGFVDGILPVETIVDVTGLPELDTLRVLDAMTTEGIVVFSRAR